MKTAQETSEVANIEIEDRIRKTISMMSPSEFSLLENALTKQFDLDFQETDCHTNHIKSIIKGKQFVFLKSISRSSRAFMTLHSLGHYYFICEARRKNIDRHAYIYDLSGQQAALHYYETEAQPNGLECPSPMTDQRRRDGVSFEVGANNFAEQMLVTLGQNHSDIIRHYSAGDIQYILDVSQGGKTAIVQTDHDYLEKYICASRETMDEDTDDSGVYTPADFNVESIDWHYLQDIKLEIHFF